MVQNTATLPSNFPEYFNGGDVGILPEQNMFAYSADGLWNARISFCGMLNYIFNSNSIAYERPDEVAAMYSITPIGEYLIWRRPELTRYIEPIPPKTLWDIEVFSIEERNSLLIDPEINLKLLNEEKIRVLINGIGNPQAPQWSVYEASIENLTITANSINIASNPNTIFKLAKSYDFHVSTIDARNLLINSPIPINVGEYVLVDGEPLTHNFWTVWQYYGPDSSEPDLDNKNFKLVRYQTYDTSDFLTKTEWYATGYSESSPPVVTYKTAKDRDNAETPTNTSVPKTTFVKIDDDGSDKLNPNRSIKWNWTEYITTDPLNPYWRVVSRKDGTIQVSSKFYDKIERPRIGFDPIRLSDIANFPNRDGCWEFRVIFEMLRDVPVLKNIELNELFFSVLNFIHTQQDQVDWAFKTSFMNIGGYNQALSQTPIQPIDNITNLTNYITEIKPYRVVIRNFDQVLAPPIDNTAINVSMLNFNIKIKQIYDRIDHMPKIYEEQFNYTTVGSLANYRDFVLKFNNSLENYIVEVFANGNKIDKTKYIISEKTISIKQSLNLNNGDLIYVSVKQNLTKNLAADRIQQFYDPANTVTAEKNLRQLLGLDFKANIIDGGNFSNNSFRDYDIDGNSTGVVSDETLNPNTRYYGLMDPKIDKNRPEELIVAHPNESVNFFVMDDVFSNSYTMSQALPSPDLMAPYQVGDYDTRPLDDVRLDIGHVQEITTTVQRIQNANSIIERPVFVIRNDAWENTLFIDTGATLLSDVHANSASLLIQPYTDGVFPFTPPREEYAYKDSINSEIVSTVTHPGAVWINNERIEYFDYTMNSNGTVNISQLRRGTRGTRIGQEQRTVVKEVGQGQNNGTGNTSFLMPELTSTDNIEVYLFTVPLDSNKVPIKDNGYQYIDSNGNTSYIDQYTGYNKLIPKIQNIDYTTTLSTTGVIVDFVTPPLAGVDIFLCQSRGVYHPIGSSLRDALVGSYGQNPIATEQFQWVTSEGSLFTVSSGATVNSRIIASDSLGKKISYRKYSGNLPNGLQLNRNGTITGIANSVSEDTTYSFIANATTSGNSISRGFTISVLSPEQITWISNANLGITEYSGPINYSNSLVAQQNHDHAITYALSSKNSNLPESFAVSSDGVFSASLAALKYPNTKTYSFIVDATSLGSNFMVKQSQTFSVTFAAKNPLQVCSSLEIDGETIPVNFSNGTTTMSLPRTYVGTIPEGVNTLQVKLWGGASSGYWYHDGGSGGFTNAIFSVNPGDDIKIEIGKTGSQGFSPTNNELYPQTAGNGGWPDGGNGGLGFGGGGGSSRLWINNAIVAVAGGAGGISNAVRTDGHTHGGGKTGAAMTTIPLIGIGSSGSQSSGGYVILDNDPSSSVNIPLNASYPDHQGGYLRGGKGIESVGNASSGAGGGGGYYGGAGGIDRAGGGGSGYVSNTSISGITIVGPFTQDSNYPENNVSLGGNSSNGDLNIPGSCGGNGFAVLKLYEDVIIPKEAVLSKPKVVFSTRKVMDNYVGPCLQVLRTSDNATLNIYFVSGVLDIASIQSFCGESLGLVNKWYDQSGNGYHAYVKTGYNGPIIYMYNSVIMLNDRPSLRFVANNFDILAFDYAMFTGPFTMSSVIKLNSNSTDMAFSSISIGEKSSKGNNPPIGIFFNASGNPELVGNSPKVSATFSVGTTPHTLTFVSNTGVDALGGIISADAYTNNIKSDTLIMSFDSNFDIGGDIRYPYPTTNSSYIGGFPKMGEYTQSSYCLDASISEIIYWDNPLSSSDLSSYHNVVIPYYGI